MEQVLYEAVRKKSEELSSPLIAINGIADHIHVAVCITPNISVAKWVGQTKGSTSHAINLAFADLPHPFRWQDGYGVLTFGAKNLPLVTNYIERQKEHHAAGTLQTYLEQIDDTP
jgi:REP element-mobilizing transposase RayT